MRNFFRRGFKKRTSARDYLIQHLERNVQAADTLEGITRYWIEHARIEIAVEEVAKALTELVKEGRIKTKEIMGVTYYYGRNIEDGSNIPRPEASKGK